MNEDTAFKRVRIRKILLPLLEDMNPNIIETLANTASLMQAVVDSSGTSKYVSGNGSALDLKELRLMPEAERTGEIRSWLGRRRGTTRQLQLKHIEAIERLVVSPKSGRTIELPGGKVVKSAGRLIYKENKVEN